MPSKLSTREGGFVGESLAVRRLENGHLEVSRTKNETTICGRRRYKERGGDGAGERGAERLCGTRLQS